MENACSENNDGDAIDANKLNSSSTKRACREDSTKMQPRLTDRDGKHVLHREEITRFVGNTEQLDPG